MVNCLTSSTDSAAASNIDSAVKACQGETGKHLHNQERVEMVKESLNDSYCDVSGRGGDLSLLGEHF